MFPCQTRTITGLQVLFILADVLPALDPAMTVFGSPLFGQAVQSRPVRGMIVFEFHIAAHGSHKLASGHMLAQVFVEFEFLPGLRVDERGDDLEEAPDDEWYCID